MMVVREVIVHAQSGVCVGQAVCSDLVPDGVMHPAITLIGLVQKRVNAIAAVHYNYSH